MAAPIVSERRATTRRGTGINKRTSDWLWALVFILPQLIGLIVFSLGPLLFAFYISLTSWDGFGNKTFIGFGNFVEQFQSPELRIALTNTLWYTAIAVPGGMILALLIALGLNNVRGKTAYRLFYFMPVVTSSVAVSVIWLYLLNGDFGIINAYLRTWFGLNPPNWLVDDRFVIPAIALVGIWWGLGFNMVIFLAGLQNVPQSLVEAAQIDGANKWQTFRNVTLPILSPTTFFVLILSVIGSFQVFDQAYVMTSGGPGRASYTMVYHIFRLAFENFTFGKSSAAAVILFAIILVLTVIQFQVQKRWVHYED
jgi:multiple sugar transport system permease protein